MSTVPFERENSVSPTTSDTAMARESSLRLRRYFGAEECNPVRIRVESSDESVESISIPFAAFRLLQEILAEMANGNAMALIPVKAELTTREAAEVLQVSRPFLIDQLEKGLMPYRKVGTHRRVLLKDLLAYKKSMEQKRIQALDELSTIDQELGFGY